MRLPNSPIGVLMTEHRLIDRMIEEMRHEVEAIGLERRVDSERIDVIAEFLSVYADRNHHGKEEDILFARLKEKELLPIDAELLEQLIMGHRYARERVGTIREANEQARGGDSLAAERIKGALEELIEFYPQHIEDEDHRFFKPAIGYFTAEERQQLQSDFERFERQLLHETYAEKVEQLQATRRSVPAKV